MEKRSLNQIIAKLKGLCWHELREGCYSGLCVHCRTSVDIYRDGTQEPKNPNWQNNIADAWELFEELPEGQKGMMVHYKLIKYEPDNWKLEVWTTKGVSIGEPTEIFIEEFGGETAPEAICKSYIAWKESL